MNLDFPRNIKVIYYFASNLNYYRKSTQKLNYFYTHFKILSTNTLSQNTLTTNNEQHSHSPAPLLLRPSHLTPGRLGKLNYLLTNPPSPHDHLYQTILCLSITSTPYHPFPQLSPWSPSKLVAKPSPLISTSYLHLHLPSKAKLSWMPSNSYFPTLAKKKKSIPKNYISC